MDIVRRPAAPVVIGTAGAIVAAPIVWLLPVVGAGTAVVLGAGLGLAVRHGARDLRRGERALPETM